mmetsp:Transcript_24233/g.62542  ORF Transcript_24233/g.62542 Transcript_24233/m.62542 type:complete len:229 (+) Transcript_24233:887-1573(+)
MLLLQGALSINMPPAHLPPLLVHQPKQGLPGPLPRARPPQGRGQVREPPRPCAALAGPLSACQAAAALVALDAAVGTAAAAAAVAVVAVGSDPAQAAPCWVHVWCSSLPANHHQALLAHHTEPVAKQPWLAPASGQIDLACSSLSLWLPGTPPAQDQSPAAAAYAAAAAAAAASASRARCCALTELHQQLKVVPSFLRMQLRCVGMLQLSAGAAVGPQALLQHTLSAQ